MKSLPATIADEVERYLRTGETDPHHAAWPGNGFMERANRARDDLRGALVREVRRLAEGLAHEPLPQADTSRSRAARSSRWCAGSSHWSSRTRCSRRSKSPSCSSRAPTSRRCCSSTATTARPGRWRTCTWRALEPISLARTHRDWWGRPSRDEDEGVAPRHRVPQARDLRLLLRGVRPRARASDEPERATRAGRGLRQHRAHLRGARRPCRGRRHRR